MVEKYLYAVHMVDVHDDEVIYVVAENDDDAKEKAMKDYQDSYLRVYAYAYKVWVEGYNIIVEPQ